MIRQATIDDAPFIARMMKEHPAALEDGFVPSIEWAESAVSTLPVFVGDYGFFLFNPINQVTWQMHPMWQGPGSRNAARWAMEQIPAVKIIGMVPDENRKAAGFFERLGFVKEGYLTNSVNVLEKLQGQTIYSMEV